MSKDPLKADQGTAGVQRHRVSVLSRIRAFIVCGMCAGSLLVSLAMSTGAFAQATGQLRFRFEPDRGMSYLLDGKYRLSDREITLGEGQHRFTFWAPERLMLDTTLTVLADRTVDILVRLRYSQEYVDFRRASERYTKQQKWGRILPPIVTGAAAIWTTVAFINYGNASTELDDLAEVYTTSADPDRIERLKTQDLPQAKSDLKAAQTQAYVATGVLVLSAAATVYIRRQLSRKEAPVFEDRERIRFEGLALLPGQQGGIWSATFSLPLR